MHALAELTGKHVPDRIPWSQIHKDTFEKMKKALSDATDNCLNTIDWSKDFNMHTDASNHLISGGYAQSDSKGSDRPIFCFSKKLAATIRWLDQMAHLPFFLIVGAVSII